MISFGFNVGPARRSWGLIVILHPWVPPLRKWLCTEQKTPDVSYCGVSFAGLADNFNKNDRSVIVDGVVRGMIDPLSIITLITGAGAGWDNAFVFSLVSIER